MQARIDEVNQRLARVQTIKRFEIVAGEFTIEGGELTPTMKIKRKAVEAKYARADRADVRRLGGRLGAAGDHWITSSARSSSCGGIVRPSAFAVLRLITSSSLLGCSIGSSPGVAPLNIRST